jgi:predicted methyltransferase
MTLRQHFSFVLTLFIAGSALTSVAHAQSDQMTRLKSALASPDRSAENKGRDAARKPVEVVEYLGIETGMTVLDIIAAGGWYTEVLSAAVGPTGKVYSQNPDFFVNREGFVEAEQERNAKLGNVEAIHGDIAAAGIDGTIDVAITNQNLHDIYNGGGEAGAMPLIQSVYNALKPGGVFAVIDHRGVAGQPNADLHRMDPAAARELLTKAGFTIDGESDVLANPADDHTKGPGDESLGGNSDRFLIKARKPN